MMNSGIEIGCYTADMGTLSTADSAVPAFKMFKRLGPDRILGEIIGDDSSIGVVASGNSDRVAVIVSHYPYLAAASEVVTKPVSIRFESMTPGSYHFTRSLVDIDHQGENPFIVEETMVESEGQLEFTFELVPYGVTLLEIASSWLGFPIDQGGWVDTGDWLGWAYVDDRPWAYILEPGIMAWFDEETDSPEGIWSWFQKSVSVSAGGDYWLGYPVGDDGWTYTGDWLGWVNVDFQPWVYILDLGNFAWFAEETDSSEGVWCWISKSL